MSTGTKVFLVVFGLFVLLVTFYYGVWTPKADGDDLNLDDPVGNGSPTANLADGTRQDFAGDDSGASGNGAPAFSQGEGARSAADLNADITAQRSTGGSLNGGAERKDRIEMGGNVLASDGLGLRANTGTSLGGDRTGNAQQTNDSGGVSLNTPRSAGGPPYVIYIVEDGDTLSSISDRWFNTPHKWTLIAKANPTINPDVLIEGQKLKLPREDAAAGRIADLDAAVANPPGASSTGRTLHTVQADENLSSIAKLHYGRASLWKLIYDANRAQIGSDPNRLKLGMQLIIPARS